MKRKKVKSLISIFLVLFIIILALFMFGFFSGEKIDPGQTEGASINNGKIKTGVVKYIIVPEYYKTIGSIHSRNEVEISSRLTAKIETLKCRNGDEVKKGGTLAVLENNELKAAVAGAEKNVEAVLSKEKVAYESIQAAKAELSAATEDYNRSKKLARSGNVSEKLLEQSEARYKQAEAAGNSAKIGLSGVMAERKAAEAALKKANTMLSYSIIKSPINGIIGERFVETGDIALPGKILFKIFDPATLMLELPVKESLINRIKIGDKVNFKVKALNMNFTGNVKEIVPYVDSETRTFIVKVCIGEERKLVPGMFGEAEILLGNKKELVVPAKAVVRTGQIETVRIIKDGRIKKAFVKTSASDINGYNRVYSGLLAGDKVLLK